MIEVWQKFKFNGDEYKVWLIYKAYEFYSRKHGDYRKYLPIKTDPRQSKSWKYFEQVHQNFSKDFVFDPYIFIEAQFRNVPKNKTIYPAQLKTKIAVEKYKEHREVLKVRDKDNGTIRIIENLASTFKFMKKWWKQHNLSIDSYSELFAKNENEIMSEGMLYCLQGMMSKYFMSVSKHFLQEYEKLDSDVKWEIISPKELRGYKIKLKLDENAYSFAKEVFNREIL